MGFLKPDTLIFKEAAKSGKIKTIRKLLKKKDFKDNHLTWALEYAIDENYLEAFQELIAHGVLKTRWDYTALSYALKKNRRDMIDIMINGNINPDINHKNNFGKTALLYACSNGNITVVKKLLELGAELDIISEEYETALTLAISKNHLEIAEILLKHGADVNNKGKTIPLTCAVQRKSIEGLELLLKYNANINTLNYSNEAPIHFAAKRNNIEALNIFLKNEKTNINIKDENHNTPLHIAAKTGNIDILKALLKSGALVNEVNNKGQTALMLAAEKGNIPAVAELLKYSADIDIICNKEKKARDYAIEGKNKETIQLIKEKEENILQNRNTSELWDLTDSEKISHITTNYKQQRRLTEIFNFRSLTHFVISENLKLKTESTSSIIPFSSINDEALKIAFAAYKKQGGKINEASVFKNKIDKSPIIR